MTEHPTSPPAPDPGPPQPDAGSPPPAPPRASPRRRAARVRGARPSADAQRARAALLAVRAEVAKAVVGQDAAVTGLLVALLCRGHVLLEGVPGVAKTLLVRTLAARARRRDQAGAVHPRPDARRRHRLAGLSTPRTASFTFRAGPGLHQPAARRRDQPHAAEDPGGAARGDGGAAGLASTAQPRPLPEPFLVARHPEPGRVRGHLPAARGPARPLPAQARAAAARSATTRSRCCAGTRPGSTRATWPRPASGRSPAPPTSPPARAAVARGAGRRPRSPATSSTSPGPPGESPSLALGVSPARRDRAAARRRGPGPGSPGATSSPPTTSRRWPTPTLRHRLALRPEAELEGVAVGARPRQRARLGPRPPLSRWRSPGAPSLLAPAGRWCRSSLRPHARHGAGWWRAARRRCSSALDVAARGRAAALRSSVRGEPAPGAARRDRRRPRSCVTNAGPRRCAACVRDAWPPSAGATRQPAPARRSPPGERRAR